ncbi:MAG: hypothetical protein IJ794_09715 [Lachnospiraceae bacterium]|nr:hypothetical protein [Lachnospiraceae bacterium]
MIRVNDKYVIEVDNYCFTAQVDLHKADKDGRPLRKNVGYYSTFAGAMQGIARNEEREVLAGQGEITLADAIRISKKIYGEFNDLLRSAMNDDFIQTLINESGKKEKEGEI